MAELEKAGKLKAIVTQNIDGLHQKAGSQNVLELHGSVHRNFCMHCHKFFDAQYMKDSTGVPSATPAAQIKPDVAPHTKKASTPTSSNKSLHYISQADMLIIGGTSLVVYPAAGLVRYYRGKKLVLINKSTTDMDSAADLVLHDAIGDVFSHIEL